jgi:hypothetical protein
VRVTLPPLTRRSRAAARASLTDLYGERALHVHPLGKSGVKSN